MLKQSDGLLMDAESLICEYGDMLFRLCFVLLRNEQDAEDALQETFLRFLSKAPQFNDNEHQKAWLIRVATNISKDIRRFRLRHTHLNIDELSNYCASEEHTGTLEELLTLPPKYRIVVHLHYAEGYDVDSIASMLDISASAVKKRLQRGREMLKIVIEKEGLS